MSKSDIKRYVVGKLVWLTDNPTTCSETGLTAFDLDEGFSGLFSIYAKFYDRNSQTNRWQYAKIYALVPEMESKLPLQGKMLVITSGEKSVANAEIIDVGED